MEKDVELNILPQACDDLATFSWNDVAAHFGNTDASQFLFKLSYDVVDGVTVAAGTRIPFPAGGGLNGTSLLYSMAVWFSML